jgi:acyl-CoA dehydrogenase
LNFDNVRVPVTDRLGDEGEGFNYLTHNLAQERLTIALQASASAQAALQHGINYVKERTIFGKPLAAFQNTKFVLAECATDVDAIVLMADRALELHDSGDLSVADAAKAKLFCTEGAGRVIDKCLQLHGGYGYVTEYPIARLYADSRVSRIYGGTSEVMKTIIAKSLGI